MLGYVFSAELGTYVNPVGKVSETTIESIFPRLKLITSIVYSIVSPWFTLPVGLEVFSTEMAGIRQIPDKTVGRLLVPIPCPPAATNGIPVASIPPVNVSLRDHQS